MKFFSIAINLALVAASVAAPGLAKGTLLPPSVPGPAPKYSIGKPGLFAKVSGRLFVLDGKKQYFSGETFSSK